MIGFAVAILVGWIVQEMINRYLARGPLRAVFDVSLFVVAAGWARISSDIDPVGCWICLVSAAITALAITDRFRRGRYHRASGPDKLPPSSG